MRIRITKNQIMSALTSYLLVWLILFSFNSIGEAIENKQAQKVYEFYDQQGHEYWFKYESVEPVKDTFQAGERLEFISNAEWKIRTIASWSDTLYCDVSGNGEFSFYSDFISGPRAINEESLGIKNKLWFYGNQNTRRTVSGSYCYLISQITVTPYELQNHDEKTRVQENISTTFYIE